MLYYATELNICYALLAPFLVQKKMTTTYQDHIYVVATSIDLPFDFNHIYDACRVSEKKK